MEVRQVAPAFQILVHNCFGTGAAIPHPQIKVRRKGERVWTKLTPEQLRRFWRHAVKVTAVESGS